MEIDTIMVLLQTLKPLTVLTAGCVLVCEHQTIASFVEESCQILVSSPLWIPLYSYSPQLDCVREGSHTAHLLHPEAAPLMGVPSIVVLLLVHNLQEWLESFLSGVENLVIGPFI